MLSGNKCRYTTTDYFESVISPMTQRYTDLFILHSMSNSELSPFIIWKDPHQSGSSSFWPPKYWITAWAVLFKEITFYVNKWAKNCFFVGTILNRVSLLQNEVYQNNQSEPVYWIWFCLKTKKSQIIELTYDTWGQNNIFFKRNFTKWFIVNPHWVDTRLKVVLIFCFT